MSVSLSLEQLQQVQHVARLAVLASLVRGVAAAEFDSMPEVCEVVVRVSVPPSGSIVELPCDVEFLAAGGVAIGGMSL